MASPPNLVLKYCLVLGLPILVFIMVVSALGALRIVPFNIISLAAIFTAVNYGLTTILPMFIFGCRELGNNSHPNVDNTTGVETGDPGTATAEMTSDESARPKETGNVSAAGDGTDAVATMSAGVRKETEPGTMTVIDITPGREAEDELSGSKHDDSEGLSISLFFSSYLLLSTGFYALILWAWFIRGSTSTYHTTQVASTFNSYFTGAGTPDILSSLTDCLSNQGNIGVGDVWNGTVAADDVLGCLWYLGVQ